MSIMQSDLQKSTESKPAAAKPRYKGKTGAQIFHEMLIQQHKVEVMFGYPGGAILPVFDELYRTPAKFILNRHEQGSGHCADGYARVTGKPGICVVTSGPAATNTVTPLATAQMDSVPIIVFSGQVPTKVIGNDAFQEADVTGITRPCTKWNYLVKDIRELPRVINEAFAIATSGRPGPVLVDLPKDISAGICPEEVDDTPRAHILAKRKMAITHPLHEKQVQEAAELINRAQKPVLYVGGGAIIAGASDAVRKVSEKANIPCTTTLLGLGAYDEHDPKALYMLGMHGSAFANYAVQESDVLIAVGARFDDRVTGNLASFAPHAKIIHIDIDPSSIGKTVDVDCTVMGDARVSLELMLPHLEHRDRKDWFTQIAGWKKKYPFKYFDDTKNAKPQYVIEELHRQTNGEAIITTGVGQHQMWAAQFYRWRYPRQMITSGGLGTMGFGLPAAIGAQLGAPGKIVIDIDGDASFLMTMFELATIAEYNIPVKIAILNNDFQGMIKQWQDLFYQRRYSQSAMKNPNFAALAESFGIKGMRCDGRENVAKTVETMLNHPGPVVVDFYVEPNEHVYPMVPSGKGLHEMELGTLA
ncbi:MAG TPA: biosynthetic-type acetolactate synthase large subunit [Tepidisphaeraceae bacterium]|jgi:acetolactate synthase-1/2/3 large subunit|nr:biosynthetic-type acetolactate synthase large subunit [Tepidisphaeraceae bacterium]